MGQYELVADHAAKRRILKILSLNWTLEGKTLVPDLRKPFDVLARGLAAARERDGEGKVTRLELLSARVLDLEVLIQELIRAAA
jgi:hypothetical protein